MPDGTISVRYEVSGAGGRGLDYEQDVDVTAAVTKDRVYYLRDTSTVTVRLLSGGGYTLGSPSEVSIAVGSTPTPRSGVGVHVNEPGALEGYTLLTSIWHNRFYLIDNQGREAYRWDRSGALGKLLDSGRLITGHTGATLGEINPDGTVAYEYPSDTQHHDVARLPNGNYLFISSAYYTNAQSIAAGANPACLGENGLELDEVVEVRPTGTSGGTVVWKWSVWDHLIQDHDSSKDNYGVVAGHPELIDLNYGLCELRDSTNAFVKDPHHHTHLNSIDYNVSLDQILITSRHFSEAWVVDHSTTTTEAAGSTGGNSGMGGDLIYRWGNPRAYKNGAKSDQTLFFPHNAHWIPSGLDGAGNVLIYNNGHEHPGFKRNYATVDEVVFPACEHKYLRAAGAYMAPTTVWTHTLAQPTWILSNAQRLPNGNTLVTEGQHGRISEVTQSGRVVWHYVSPLVTGTDVLTGNESADNASDIWIYRTYKYAADHPGIVALSLVPQSERLPIGGQACTVTPTSNELVTLVRGYHDNNKTRADYDQDWFRVLIAFGAETSGTLEPFTAAEAQAAQQIWSGWAPVTQELQRLEREAANCAGENTPPTEPSVSVSAGSAVTEGSAAVFTVTASPAPSAAITVNVSVSSVGEYAPTATRTVTIPTSGSATLNVATIGDSVDEADGSVTVAVTAGTGYRVGSPRAAAVTVRDDDEPAGPAGLAAAVGDSRVWLSWADPADDSITGYQYQQQTRSGGSWPAWGASWSAMGGSSSSTTGYAVSSLANATEYRFRIRAVNASGAGDPSDAVSATPVDGVEGHVPRLKPATIQTLFAPNTAAASSPAYVYMNDHTVYRDVNGKWHVIGTANNRVPGQTAGENQFAHGVADSLLGPYTRRPDIDPNGSTNSAFAPHAITFNGKAYMFYGPKVRGLVTSSDLVTWTNETLSVTYPAHDRITDHTTPRDQMVLEDGGTYYKYITSVDPSAGNQNVVDVLQSTDLITWSYVDHALTLSGDAPKESWGTAESPFVVKYAGSYYLFVTVTDTNANNDNYHQTLVFRSDSPTDFGDFNGDKVNPEGAQLVTELPVHAPEVVLDPANNKWYITTTGWDFRQRYTEATDGVAIIEMEWITAPANDTPIPNTGWTLHEMSSQNEGHPGAHAFDRDPTTYWESGSGSQPHTLDINLGAVYDLNGFVYVPEPHGGSGGVNGVITRYRLYVSADGANWGDPAASGTFDNSIIDNNARKLVTFSTRRGQYIRLESTAAVGGSVSRAQDLGVLGSYVSGPNPPPDDPGANRAPTVASAISDVSGLEAGTTREVSLAGVFSDADGDAVTITAASDDRAVATVSVASDRSRLTVMGVAEGTATITVTAEDADGLRVSDTFVVLVVPEPERPPGAPRVAAPLPDLNLKTLQWQDFSLADVFTDPDGDDLTFGVISSHYDVVRAWLRGSSLYLVAAGPGTAIITVTAEDADGNEVSDSFEVTVGSSTSGN